MKNILLVSTFILIFICLNLCGCTDLLGGNNTSDNTDKVELVDTYIENADYGLSSGKYYKGIIKNTAGYRLDLVKVTGYFYDKDDNLLFSRTTNLYGIPNSYTKEFSIYINSVDNYYENIDYVKYAFDVS